MYLKASLETHDSMKGNGRCESHFIKVLLKHYRNAFAVSTRFPEITTNIFKICVSFKQSRRGKQRQTNCRMSLIN